MHPVLARYINLDAAMDVLRREQNGEVLKAEEKPFAEAARELPEHRDVLLKSGGKGGGAQVQQAVLVLAAHAALRAVRGDSVLAEPCANAQQALLSEGASPEEASELLATLLLEEAFGYEDDPDQFDRDFVRASLEEIPQLAKLNRARVDALVRTFGEKAEKGWANAHEQAARALFEAAWSEGPQAINPEHLTDALESLWAKFPKSERGRAGESLRRFIEFLREERLVSAERARRLTAVIFAREAGETPTGMKQ